MINDKFWSQVNFTKDCWLWIGSLDKGAYGRFWDGKRRIVAHRFSYSILIRPLKKNERLKHVCENTLCVRPEHLVVESVNFRFWKNIAVRGIDNCWNWLGSKDDYGYGYFYRDGKTTKAHRVAWELSKGKIPNGLLVCHHCDNPSCVNPKHLFVGTVIDNTRDMIKKGRKINCRGSKQGNHKLTEDNVLDIKRKLNLGSKQKDLAKEYDVSPANICLISKGKNWGWLNEDNYDSSN